MRKKGWPERAGNLSRMVRRDLWQQSTNNRCRCEKRRSAAAYSASPGKNRPPRSTLGRNRGSSRFAAEPLFVLRAVSLLFRTVACVPEGLRALQPTAKRTLTVWPAQPNSREYKTSTWETPVSAIFRLPGLDVEPLARSRSSHPLATWTPLADNPIPRACFCDSAKIPFL